MKIKKYILLFIIIILIVFIVILTLYKFKNSDNNEINDDIIYSTFYPVNTKKDLKYDYMLDEEVYADYIEKPMISMDFSIINNLKSITGKIYIDKNNELHITDDLESIDKVISELKFKDLKPLESDEYGALYVYLISNDNKLYYLMLDTNNIYDAAVYEIEMNKPVLRFSNISYDNDVSPSSSTLFVLCSDGNIYEVTSKLRYHNNIKLVFGRVMVYEDNTMSNIYGKMFEDNNGNYYKIKYIFNALASDAFLDKPVGIIITEDNQLIVSIIDEYYRRINVANKKIKNIEFDKKSPFVTGKLKLEFEGGKKMEFDANCSVYYCINNFDF